jgi:hypothetical protein
VQPGLITDAIVMQARQLIGLSAGIRQNERIIGF